MNIIRNWENESKLKAYSDDDGREIRPIYQFIYVAACVNKKKICWYACFALSLLYCTIWWWWWWWWYDGMGRFITHTLASVLIKYFPIATNSKFVSRLISEQWNGNGEMREPVCTYRRMRVRSIKQRNKKNKGKLVKYICNELDVDGGARANYISFSFYFSGAGWGD